MVERQLRIEFLYWEDCPSHGLAWDRLQSAIQKKDLRPEIVRIEIRTDEEARERDFPGSPTIRINGVDIDPEGVKVQHIGLSCRIYHTPDGRVSPVPSEEMIRKAIELLTL